MESSQKKSMIAFVKGVFVGLLLAAIIWQAVELVTHTRWWRSQLAYWDEADNMAETSHGEQ